MFAYYSHRIFDINLVDNHTNTIIGDWVNIIPISPAPTAPNEAAV